MLTPLWTCSLPIAMPRARSRERFQLGLESSEVEWKAVLTKLSQDLRGCSIDTSGESGREISKAHSEGRVFKTETREVGDGCDVPDAAAIFPAYASSDVDLLFERPGGNLDAKTEKG